MANLQELNNELVTVTEQHKLIENATMAVRMIKASVINTKLKTLLNGLLGEELITEVNEDEWSTHNEYNFNTKNNTRVATVYLTGKFEINTSGTTICNESDCYAEKLEQLLTSAKVATLLSNNINEIVESIKSVINSDEIVELTNAVDNHNDQKWDSDGYMRKLLNDIKELETNTKLDKMTAMGTKLVYKADKWSKPVNYTVLKKTSKTIVLTYTVNGYESETRMSLVKFNNYVAYESMTLA